MSTNSTILQNKFNLGYKKASMQERMIIDKTEGPVTVIADQNTAVTDILSLRIANILTSTETKAENIYWFTSPDSPSIEIQQQFDSIVGTHTKINIQSFQTFCEKLLQEFGELPEYKSLQPISISEYIQLIKELIDGFPKNHPLKRYRSDVYHEIFNLHSLFSFMKKAGFTSESLLIKMNGLHQELLSPGEINIDFLSDPQSIDKILADQMKAGINEFNHYQSLLKQNNRYDSDDIIYLVIQAFENNNNLLKRYQEKCKYILVDDWDAVNFPARKLLELLLDANMQPNLLVVNYDQSTVFSSSKMQGDNTIVFPKNQSANWQTIRLKDNGNNLPRRELLHKPVIRSYHSESEEMAGIVNQVEELLHQNIDANKIAVIYEDDKFGSAIEAYFALKNIPVYLKRNVPVLEHPFIKKIIQLLRYVSTELDVAYSGDDLLFEILHFDFYEIPPVEIARLTVEANSKRYSKTPTAIRKLLKERANAPAKDLFDPGIHKNLKQASIHLEKIIEDASKDSLREIVEKIIRYPPIIQYVALSKDPIGLQILLTSLGDFIQNETFRNPGLQLNELIDVIDTMEHGSLPLSLTCITGSENDVQVIKAEEVVGRKFNYLIITGSNNATRLKEDWLEIVYKIPGINFSGLPNSFNTRRYRALLQLLSASLKGNSTQLFVTFTKNGSEENKSTARFLINFFSAYSIPAMDIKMREDELFKYVVLDKAKMLPEIAQPDESLIEPILKKFVMNVSALNNYLNCPLGFYYKNILRVPAGKSEAMEFGSAIHFALETLFKKMSSGQSESTESFGLADKYQFPSAGSMVQDFYLYMNNHRSSFTGEAFERRMAYGGEVLENYYHQYFDSWNKVVSVERNIRSRTKNGIPIKGKLDKLEFNGKEVTIIDYKSGDLDKAIPKLKGPNDNNPNGGDYWRQAVFYKILVDNYDQKDWKAVSTEFDFVEPDKNKMYRKEKIAITPADIETVTRQITTVWKNIRDRSFYTGCGRPGCHWCNFVKDNKLAVALHRKEIITTTN